METSVASSNNTNMAEQKLPETIGEGEAGEGELMKSPVATSKPYDVNTSSSGNVSIYGPLLCVHVFVCCLVSTGNSN